LPTYGEQQRAIGAFGNERSHKQVLFVMFCSATITMNHIGACTQKAPKNTTTSLSITSGNRFLLVDSYWFSIDKKFIFPGLFLFVYRLSMHVIFATTDKIGIGIAKFA
jgi:hypothetical protein